MPRRATTMAAAGVILAGLAGALVFRREPAAAPETSASVATEGDVLVRRRSSSGPSGVRSAAPLINQVDTLTHSPASPPRHASPPAATPPPPERLAKAPSMPQRYNPFSQPPASSAPPSSAFTSPPFQTPPVQARPPYAPPPMERTGETPVPPGHAGGQGSPMSPGTRVPPEYTGGTPVPPVARAHIVVDGDTLTDLAELYLGSGRRYTELFEANRDVLQHPDLLPIGARLKIPGNNTVSPPTAKADDLVPIPANAWRRGRREP